MTALLVPLVLMALPVRLALLVLLDLSVLRVQRVLPALKVSLA